METTTANLERPSIGVLTLADLGKARTVQVLGVVSVFALIFIYAHTFEWWWAEWTKPDSEYSHGVLIPFMSGFVIWFYRKQILDTPVRPSAWGLALLLPAILVQYLAHGQGVFSLSGFTFPVALVGASLMLFGSQVTKRLLFPVGFLYFMCVPPTSFVSRISLSLQELSTVAATSGPGAAGRATDPQRPSTQATVNQARSLSGQDVMR